MQAGIACKCVTHNDNIVLSLVEVAICLVSKLCLRKGGSVFQNEITCYKCIAVTRHTPIFVLHFFAESTSLLVVHSGSVRFQLTKSRLSERRSSKKMYGRVN